MQFKALSPTEWDAERGDVDFHIRLEHDDYVIEVFDSDVLDAYEAHLTTYTCETWEHVVQYCQAYDGINVF